MAIQSLTPLTTTYIYSHSSGNLWTLTTHYSHRYSSDWHSESDSFPVSKLVIFFAFTSVLFTGEVCSSPCMKSRQSKHLIGAVTRTGTLLFHIFQVLA